MHVKMVMQFLTRKMHIEGYNEYCQFLVVIFLWDAASHSVEGCPYIFCTFDFFFYCYDSCLVNKNILCYVYFLHDFVSVVTFFL